MLGPAHEVTANFDGPSVLDFVAQTGMLRDDKQNALDIQADVARCGGAAVRLTDHHSASRSISRLARALMMYLSATVSRSA